MGQPEDIRLASDMFESLSRTGVTLVPGRNPISGIASETGWGHNEGGTYYLTLPSCLMLARRGVTVSQFIEAQQIEEPLLSYESHLKIWLMSEESIIYQILMGLHRESWVCPSTGLNAWHHLKDSEGITLKAIEEVKGSSWLTTDDVVKRCRSLFFQCSIRTEVAN